jgi:hypothetical protein
VGHRFQEEDMKRREWMSAVGALSITSIVAEALAKGDVPPGIAKLDGNATVNGREAKIATPVTLGDRVVTGKSSQAVVVVGSDAFLMRQGTTIEFGRPGEGVLSTLLVSAGQVLSVFSKKPVAIKAASASIGIRGTGAYIEIHPSNVYFCLCYGEALVEGPGMANAREVKTTHHESPLLLREDGGVMTVEPGPFQNHSDAELIMLEALVGREPPFMKDGTYPAKKY